MNNTVKIQITTLIFVLMASASFAFSMLTLTGSVPGANIEKYNENTHKWDSYGSFPKTLVCYQYEYVQIHISAPGYKDFNYGYDVRWPGGQKFAIEMESEILDPDGLALFAFEGIVTSRSGKDVTQFVILVRNMTAYNAGKRGQLSEDSNPITSGGYYTAVLGDMAVPKAVKVGDRLLIGVFTADKTRCLGYKCVTVKQTDIENDLITTNITIK